MRQVKFCRNCVWSASGWCEFYQQELKPCAGHCTGFMTKRKKAIKKGIAEEEVEKNRTLRKRGGSPVFIKK